MAAFRSLMYIGLVIAVIVGWISQRKPKSSKKDPFQQGSALHPDDPVRLQAALQDNHWQRRLEGIRVLCDHPSPHSLEQLLLLCADPVNDVREAAAHGIRVYGHKALDRLHDMLRNGNLDGRETAVHLLLELQSPESQPIFIDVLRNDESAWVRIPAVQALARFGDDDAEIALIEALHDPHSGVVGAVRLALTQLGTETALAALNQTHH